MSEQLSYAPRRYYPRARTLIALVMAGFLFASSSSYLYEADFTRSVVKAGADGWTERYVSTGCSNGRLFVRVSKDFTRIVIDRRPRARTAFSVLWSRGSNHQPDLSWTSRSSGTDAAAFRYYTYAASGPAGDFRQYSIDSPWWIFFICFVCSIIYVRRKRWQEQNQTAN
jgi:hypothetical protein